MIAIDIRKLTDQPGIKDHVEVRLMSFKTTQVKVKGKRTQIRIEPIEDKIFMFEGDQPEDYAKAFLTIATFKEN